jgi:hypothetical protein
MPEGYTVTYRVPYGGEGGRAGQTLAGGGNPAAAYGPNASIPIQQGPRYFEGDQWQQAPTNSQDILAVQQAMVQTGLLSAKEVTYGQWDPTSANAFAKLLGIANGAGVEWRDALAARMAAAGSDEAKAQARADRLASVEPLTIKLSNPDDLKTVAQNVAKTLYGGNLPDEDVQRFVASYQSAEREAQTAQWNAKYGQYVDTGVAPTQVNMPSDPASADSVIAAQIQREHPEQVAATGIGTAVMKSLDNLRTTGYL